MKKLILSLFAVLASISVNAQTVNVHLKNGEAVRYNSTEVDYVDFSEESVDPTPVPTPVPSIGNPVITFSVNIVNRSGKDVTLDGTVEFLLGNPDHNGTYLGWEGSYNYTDPIRFAVLPLPWPLVKRRLSTVLHGVMKKQEVVWVRRARSTPINGQPQPVIEMSSCT